VLTRLSRGQLAQLSQDLKTGKGLPNNEAGAQLASLGLTHEQAAKVVDLLIAERQASERHPLELVWSGPESAAAMTRDTSVVVAELVASARERVLISTYNVHRPREQFQGLASRMDAAPNLATRIFLNVMSAGSAAEFARAFWGDWPGARRPEVFYDPRSLDKGARAVLHAKCVVVDGRRALVTSANLSESAQERNFELGLLVESGSLAREIEAQFDSLITSGLAAQLPR
jgi:phosphatidylserine/phosphatidylglycerophosphate/cardiolipin synthase-like enzyme